MSLFQQQGCVGRPSLQAKHGLPCRTQWTLPNILASLITYALRGFSARQRGCVLVFRLLFQRNPMLCCVPPQLHASSCCVPYLCLGSCDFIADEPALARGARSQHVVLHPAKHTLQLRDQAAVRGLCCLLHFSWGSQRSLPPLPVVVLGPIVVCNG